MPLAVAHEQEGGLAGTMDSRGGCPRGGPRRGGGALGVGLRRAPGGRERGRGRRPHGHRPPIPVTSPHPPPVPVPVIARAQPRPTAPPAPPSPPPSLPPHWSGAPWSGPGRAAPDLPGGPEPHVGVRDRNPLRAPHRASESLQDPPMGWGSPATLGGRQRGCTAV